MDEFKQDKKSTVPPQRIKKLDSERHILTPEQIFQLIVSARSIGRCGLRDSTLVLMTYRHALRVGEVIRLRWEQLALEERRLQVTRLKKGTPSTHTLSNDEVDALFQLRQEKPGSEFVFVSERNGPLTRRAVHTVIARAAKVAGIPFAVHPFMLRHARGYQLGAKGVSLRTIQSYLGHKNVQHTIAYTPHAGENFDNLDDDTD